MFPLLALALVACDMRGPAAPIAPYNRMENVHTVANQDASRIWIVQHNGIGEDHVVFCDIEMLKQTKSLCTRWPMNQ